jgi:dipeptidyl aminopeptidase/acylaminoacyl peptidase
MFKDPRGIIMRKKGIRIILLTPTLIQHGDKDNRVPVPNAFELYRALQDFNVESELVIFKDMAHIPQRPGIYKAIMEQNLGWFMEYIK